MNSMMRHTSQKSAIPGLSFGILLIMGVMVFLSACAAPSQDEYVEEPVDILYNAAKNNLDKGNYKIAAKGFDEVERQHPYSKWATKGQLMAAFSYYMDNDYDDAVITLDRFIQLHPSHSDTPYAYYLKALCYYEQISTVDRDQQMTSDALRTLNELITRFPESSYAKDARVKLDLTFDHLAGKEMEIGRFYQTTGELFAAIGRFNNVVKSYETTSHAPEALHRITEAYLALGIVMEAEKSASVLALNYPNSDWNRYSSELLQKHRN